MGAVHKFDPATSGEHDTHPWWADWYRRAFDTYVSHDIVTDRTLQRQGIDHRVHLSGGAEILIDAKCRCNATQWHNDVLVEAWSDAERRVVGWARKPLRCHYIAYAWPQYEVGSSSRSTCCASPTRPTRPGGTRTDSTGRSTPTTAHTRPATSPSPSIGWSPTWRAP